MARVKDVVAGIAPLKTIDENASLAEAQKLLDEGRGQTGRLGVLSDGKLVGVVGRHEIRLHREMEKAGLAVLDIERRISPNDCMFDGNRLVYLADGLSALVCIRRGQEAAGTRDVSSLLDFGCGHGRVLRMLKRAYPEAIAVGCDVDEDAVEFCRVTLEVRAFLSHEDPRRIDLDERFDLMWAGSVLTHVPSNRWPYFLEWFESHLAPGGAVVFTAQGFVAAEQLRSNNFQLGLAPALSASLLEQFDQHEFGYVDYPHIPGYGCSLSTPQWIERLVGETTAMRIIDLNESAWGSQDVLTLGR